MANRWMQKESKREAHAGTKGSFSASAARHGESTQQYAHEHDKGNSKTAKRARMAEMFAKAKH
jgi:hypothetical protein